MRPRVWSPWQMAQEDPQRVAVITSEGETLTFSLLVDLAERIGSGLVALGCPDGTVIGCSLPAGPAFFALALAALRGGYGLYPIEQAVPQRARLLRASGAAFDIAASPQPCGEDLVPQVPLSELIVDSARSGVPGKTTAAGFLIHTTSGSTGEPQIARGYRPWYGYRGVAVQPRYFAGPDCGPHVMANPTFHRGTLGPALHALQAGSAVVVQHDWSPARFDDLAAQHGADSAFLSPDQLLEVVRYGRIRHRFRVLMHGGSSCTPALKRAGIALFGPVLHEFYGISQGVITEITPAEWRMHPDSVGRPMPGVRVAMHDDRGLPVPVGHAGHVWVNLRQSGTAAHRTGDIGYLDDDGYLHILGRSHGPQPLLQARLESTIRRLSGVLEVQVSIWLDRSEKGAAALCTAELDPRATDVEAAIRNVFAEAGIHDSNVELRSPSDVARTRSGKLRVPQLANDDTTKFAAIKNTACTGVPRS